MVSRPAPAPVEGWQAPAAMPAATTGGAVAPLPDAEVMAILATVPDPEIPVLSLVDLGVIRGLEWGEDGLDVLVTPTYSGCPATAVIEMSVERALRERGIPARVRRVIAPPWTTDWITPDGHAKLERYGIAPPSPGGPKRCPRCHSPDTEEVSRFGSTPCKAQHRCRACGEPFDAFKCH